MRPPPPATAKPSGVNSRHENAQSATISAVAFAGRLEAQAESDAEARADAEAAAESDIADMKGVLAQIVQGHENSISAAERLQSMAETANSTCGEQRASAVDGVDRLQGMAMNSAASLAKLDSKAGLDQEIAEAMLIQKSMNAAKFEKSITDRIESLQSMLMTQAHALAKLGADVAQSAPRMKNDSDSMPEPSKRPNNPSVPPRVVSPPPRPPGTTLPSPSEMDASLRAEADRAAASSLAEIAELRESMASLNLLVDSLQEKLAMHNDQLEVLEDGQSTLRLEIREPGSGNMRQMKALEQQGTQAQTNLTRLEEQVPILFFTTVSRPA
eukprot:SAG31_NODE_5786_length_2330_cov_1.543702_1_plen_327_part_10